MMDGSRKLLTWILAITLLITAGTTGYLAMNPELTTQSRSEFYIVPDSAATVPYPEEMYPNSTARVKLGIDNHEHRKVTYEISVRWNQTQTQARKITLDSGETERIPLTIQSPSSPGKYEVRFRLDKSEGSGSTLQTRLWIRVSKGVSVN